MYYAYMVRCVDGSLYTGWSIDVQKRVVVHNSGRGAKYTRTRRPVTLVWSEAFPTQHEAMHWEYVIKQWPRDKKERLIHVRKTGSL
jgi:putative endonuclease